jgi:rhodanese-related sulfurtransferase
MARRWAMPKDITRDELLGLLGRGAQLVDVLPAEEYADSHLPGAISVPLKKLDRQTTAELREDAPVVVYCHDLQ